MPNLSSSRVRSLPLSLLARRPTTEAERAVDGRVVVVDRVGANHASVETTPSSRIAKRGVIEIFMMKECCDIRVDEKAYCMLLVLECRAGISCVWHAA